MASPPDTRTIRRSYVLPLAILVVCCVLGFAGRWLFVRWIVSSAEATINRAKKTLARDPERPASARGVLEWLLWAEPSHAEATLLLATILQAEGRVSEALACYDRIPAGSPSGEKSRSAAALMCLEEGRLEEAETRLVQCLQKYPDSPLLRDELRWLYFNQLRTRDVETFLESELQRAPDDLAPAVDLLTCEFRKQMPREGIGYLQECNLKYPEQASVKAAIGYCLWQIGQPEEARDMFEKALELKPDNSRIRELVADFLLDQGGQADQAAELLEATPTGDNGWYLLSRCSEQQGQIEKAEEQMQSALKLRPGELKYVQRRGELLRRLGRGPLADQTLQQANRLEAAQTELSELVLRGQHEQATIKICEQLSRLNQTRQRDVQAQAWQRAARLLKSRAESRK